jgi:hypothetical protein
MSRERSLGIIGAERRKIMDLKWRKDVMKWIQLAQESQMADFCDHSDEPSTAIKKGISLPDEYDCIFKKYLALRSPLWNATKHSNILTAVNCTLCEFPAFYALRLTAIFYVTVRITLVINCIVLNSWCRLLGTYGGQWPGDLCEDVCTPAQTSTEICLKHWFGGV